MTNYQTPTAETYMGLERAFDFFNARLFQNRLPPVMFTMTRKKGAHGYFWAEQFAHRDEGLGKTHEIALNPETMSRTLEAVLSTLVHEMTHLEQQEEGTPGKGGNHNKEWAGLMRRVGLIPSDTGLPGGKETGRKVTHYIDEEGGFFQAYLELKDTGFDIPYFTAPKLPTEKKKDLSKVKHECPCCGFKAWAKQGANLVCGDCDERLVGEYGDAD